MRLLLERGSSFVDSESDRYTLVQAIALDGLHFPLLPPDEGRRIAIAVRTAAEQLPLEHRNGPEERDREFAAMLGDLSMWLTELAEGAR